MNRVSDLLGKNEIKSGFSFTFSLTCSNPGKMLVYQTQKAELPRKVYDRLRFWCECWLLDPGTTCKNLCGTISIDCSEPSRPFSRIFIWSLNARIESRENWMPAQTEVLTGWRVETEINRGAADIFARVNTERPWTNYSKYSSASKKAPRLEGRSK